ncbi:hypothetical protein [Sideroxydans sp. CL21]|nr:hypothetical protein [Sideroxydans sp. CL21]
MPGYLQSSEVVMANIFHLSQLTISTTLRDFDLPILFFALHFAE